MDLDTTLKNLALELRRGTLTLAVLSQLTTAQYGYSLLQRLAARGVDIDQNTLYPLLRRLESQQLLDSDWSVEGSRPRRYYVLSEQGRSALSEIMAEWYRIVDTVNGLLRPDAQDGDDTYGVD